MRLASLLFPVAALAASPHKETRFLLPTYPLLFSYLKYRRVAHAKRPSSHPFRVFRGVFVLQIIFSAIVIFFLGLLHQGRILESVLKAKSDTVYWNTYPPPSFLNREVSITWTLADAEQQSSFNFTNITVVTDRKIPQWKERECWPYNWSGEGGNELCFYDR